MADEDFRLQLSAEIGSDSISKVKSQLDDIQKSAKPITLTGDIGALTKEIGELRSQLKSVSGVKIDANIKSATNSYKELVNVAKQIGNKQIEIAKLDTRTNANEIKALEAEIDTLTNKTKTLMGSLGGKLSGDQFKQLENTIKEVQATTQQTIDTINAKMKDKSAVEFQKRSFEDLKNSIKVEEKELAQGYSNLISKAKELSTEMTKFNKLEDPMGKNKLQADTIKARIEELRIEYDKLYESFNKRLSTEQLAEIESVFKKDAYAIEEYWAKIGDTSAIRRQEQATREYAQVLEQMKHLQSTTENAGFRDSVGTATIEGYKAKLEELKAKELEVREKFADLIPQESITEAKSGFSNIGTNIDNIVSKAEQAKAKLVEAIQGTLANGSASNYDVAISKVSLDMSKLSAVSDETREKVRLLKDTLAEMRTASESGDVETLISKEREFSGTLKQVQNELKITADREKELAQAEKLTAAEIKLLNDRTILSNQMSVWLKENSAAAKQFGNQIRLLQAEVKSCDNVRLGQIRQEFKMITQEAKIAGKTGLTFTDRLGYQIKKLSTYFSGLYIIMSTYRTLKTGVETVIELDTALVDLKKTTDGTTEQLNEFYNSASEIGKQLGVTAQNVIQASADWSRLGLIWLDPLYRNV